MTRLPTLFISHGSPMLAIEDSPAGRFLDALGSRLPLPRAIVVASAHYEAATPSVGGAEYPITVHDFGGFPPELYALRYPASGETTLARRIIDLLQEASITARVDTARGLDHGVWVPLRRIYPDAEIPVVPIAVDPRLDARTHHAMGAALSTLRDEGVLVIGSGGFVHNLGALDWRDPAAPMPPWAAGFAEWMRTRLASGDREALFDWSALAPDARLAHPTTEHLMPLFVALGAAGPAATVETLHRSHEYGSLALDAFAFH